MWCAVPINLHIGNMGVASAYPQTVDSVPPAIHGGNVDDRRIGKGATMYYPVQVSPPQPRSPHIILRTPISLKCLITTPYPNQIESLISRLCRSPTEVPSA